MTRMMTDIVPRLKEVNDIISTCSDGMMRFEQANVIARFDYDYQDTNALIDEAERLATEDTGRLREFAVSLKDETATFLNNIGRLDGMDFKQIANDHSKQYYSRFQEASEKLTPSVSLTTALIISLSAQRSMPRLKRNVRRLRQNTIHGRLR